MARAAIVLKLKLGSWAKVAQLAGRGLARSSLFVQTGGPGANPPAVGTALRVELVLPSGDTLCVDGSVLRIVEASATRKAGVDVSLSGADAFAQSALEKALASAPPDESAPVPIHFESSVPAAAPVPAPAPPKPDLATRLTSELERLRTLTASQILEVSELATDDEVAAAHSRAVARLFPDGLPREPNAEVRGLVRDLVDLLGRARARVKNPASSPKLAVPVSLSPGPESARVERVPVPVPRGAILPRSAAPVPTPRLATGTSPSAPRELSADSLFGDLAALPEEHSGPVSLGGRTVSLDQASTHLDAGRYHEARVVYEAALRTRPDDVNAQVGRALSIGFLRLAEGDQDGACAQFEQALKIDPTSERAARELAAVRQPVPESRRGLISKLMTRK